MHIFYGVRPLCCHISHELRKQQVGELLCLKQLWHAPHQCFQAPPHIYVAVHQHPTNKPMLFCIP